MNNQITKIISLAEDLNFEHHQVDEENCTINFFNKDSDTKKLIHLVFRPKFNQFIQVNDFIILPKINNIINRFEPHTDHPLLINYKSHNQWGKNMDMIKTHRIDSDTSFPLFKSSFTKYYKSHIYPFFQEFPTLQSINQKILIDLPQSEWRHWIPGQTKNFKVLIIMKLCRNPKYEEFKQWALTSYQKGVELDPQEYGAELDILKQLIEYLDTTPDLPFVEP